MQRFDSFFRSLGQCLTQFRRPETAASPGLTMLPNPCQLTDSLTLHLRGLRCCPTRVQVRANNGDIVLERQVFPLSDHHRLPLTLPRDTPAGMYRCVASPPGRADLKS